MSAFCEALRYGWVGVLLLSPPPAISASIDAGRASYQQYCLGCHGTPPTGLKIDLLRAANRPDLIRQTIARNPPMQFLSPLGDSTLSNIATYLANPVSSDADCLLGWGEVNYATLLAPRTLSATAGGYTYRHYPPDLYVGVAQNSADGQLHLYTYSPPQDTAVRDLGPAAPYLSQALAAGCP